MHTIRPIKPGAGCREVVIMEVRTWSPLPGERVLRDWALAHAVRDDTSWDVRTVEYGDASRCPWTVITYLDTEHLDVQVCVRNPAESLTMTKLWQLIDVGTLELVSWYLAGQNCSMKLGYDGGFLSVVSLEGLSVDLSLSDVSPGIHLLGLGKIPSDGPDDEGIELRLDLTRHYDVFTRTAEFVRDYAEGHANYPAAGIAYSAWRTRYQGPPVQAHGLKPVQEFERAAYYGGYCQSFFLGRVDRDGPTTESDYWSPSRTPARLGGTAVHVYDVQGFYPWLQTVTPVPRRLLWWIPEADINRMDSPGDGVGVIAQVLISDKKNPYPVRIGGKVQYCTGQFWTVLCGPELRDAVKKGSVKDISGCATYELSNVLEAEGQWWRSVRERCKAHGNRLGERLAKVLGVTLHGYLGRRASRWMRAPFFDAVKRWGIGSVSDPESGDCYSARWLAGQCEVCVKDIENDHALIAIPAWIAAAGRSRLRALIDCLPDASVLYADTDCVHVTKDGAAWLEHNMLIAKEIVGNLTFRGSFDTAEYYGPKFYRLGDSLTCSGLPRIAVDCTSGVYSFSEEPTVERMAELGPMAVMYGLETRQRYLPRATGMVYDAKGWGHCWSLNEEAPPKDWGTQGDLITEVI